MWQLYKVAGDYSRKINSVDVTRGTFVISLVILSVNGDDAVHTIKDGVIIKLRHGWTTVIVVCAIILLGEVIVQWGVGGWRVLQRQESPWIWMRCAHVLPHTTTGCECLRT